MAPNKMNLIKKSPTLPVRYVEKFAVAPNSMEVEGEKSFSVVIPDSLAYCSTADYPNLFADWAKKVGRALYDPSVRVQLAKDARRYKSSQKWMKGLLSTGLLVCLGSSLYFGGALKSATANMDLLAHNLTVSEKKLKKVSSQSVQSYLSSGLHASLEDSKSFFSSAIKINPQVQQLVTSLYDVKKLESQGKYQAALTTLETIQGARKISFPSKVFELTQSMNKKELDHIENLLDNKKYSSALSKSEQLSASDYFARDVAIARVEQAIIQEASDLVSSQKYDACLHITSEIVHTKPHSLANVQRGLAWDGKGHEDLAIQSFSRVLSDSMPLRAKRELGKVCLKKYYDHVGKFRESKKKQRGFLYKHLKHAGEYLTLLQSLSSSEYHMQGVEYQDLLQEQKKKYVQSSRYKSWERKYDKLLKKHFGK